MLWLSLECAKTEGVALVSRRRVGKPRVEPSRNLEACALITSHATDGLVSGDLIAAREIIVDLEPGERTWKDVAQNPRRRVDRPPNEAARTSGNVAGSNRENAYIFLDVMLGPGAIFEVANIRAESARWLRHRGNTRVGLLELTMSARARQRHAGAAIRLLDRRADPDAPSLADLHRAGARCDTPEWQELRELRDIHNLAGFIVRSTGSRLTIILNLHASELLFEADLVSAAISHDPVSADGLPRLERMVDTHHLVVAQFIRFLRDQAQLAEEFWLCARAWMPGKPPANLAAQPTTQRKRRRTIGIVTFLLTATAAVIRFSGVI
jgi:hypothetical protein